MKDKEIDCICTQQVRAEIAYDFRWHTEECLIYNRKKARADTAREFIDWIENDDYLMYGEGEATDFDKKLKELKQKYLKSEGEKG